VVNEAYVRLAAAGKVASDNRNHFFALSAHVMRCILIDYARQQQRRERNGGAQIVWLENVLLSASKNPEHVLSFDEALTRLSKEHPRKGRLVELHSFGGLRLAEAAQFLQVFENTAQRDLKFTKAWMSRELGQHEAQ
jgi:RNA polymerase sigma factor (TIGR02999 family)